MKIVVLCGGLSPERNVSLSSGTMVAKALSECGHKVVLTDMYFGLEDYEGKIDEIFDKGPELFSASVAEDAPDLDEIAKRRKLKSESSFGLGVLDVCSMADMVFIALHGRCGEDGKVQATFDLLGIKYTGTGFLGSAIAMDKDITKRVLLPLGLKTAKWCMFDSADLMSDVVLSEVSLPLVIKPVDSGSSIGVYIAHTAAELSAAIESAKADGGRHIVEQYIKGREIQIAVLNGKALPSIEIMPREGFYDYKNKYQPGAAVEVCPSPISAEAELRVAAAAESVYRALGLEVYCRADFIYDEDGEFWFLEMNTLPGMTPTSLVPQEAAAVGMTYKELCDRIVSLSEGKYR